MEQLLKSLGITLIKKDGNSYIVESPISDRAEFLRGLAKSVKGTFVQQRFGKSSVGRIEVPGKSYIYAKNKKGDKAGGTSYEVEVVNQFNDIISNIGYPINIRIPGLGEFKNISHAVQVDAAIKRKGGAKADPKADIILVTQNQDVLHPKNIFISHKKEGGAEAFQQYSGVTERAGKFIYEHEEVQNFLRAVVPRIANDKLEHALMADIKSDILVKKSIYGPDFGESNHYSLQNCTLLAQGRIRTLREVSRGLFELDFTHGMHNNGDLSIFKNPEYKAVLGATFRAGRGFKLDGKQYMGARIGIYPKSLIARRCKQDHQIIK